MSTIYRDPRRAVVSVTMRRGDDCAEFNFQKSGPSESTLRSIVACMLDGYRMTGHRTVPLHDEAPTGNASIRRGRSTPV